MAEFGVEGNALTNDPPRDVQLPHPSARIVADRTKNVTIAVLTVALGAVAFAQFVKPSRPNVPNSTSVTLAPRSPL
jgi:hypothetical protein